MPFTEESDRFKLSEMKGEEVCQIIVKIQRRYPD
jgi:hypothetical protein